MSDSRLRQITWLTLIGINGLVWWSVLHIGFFVTTAGLIIFAVTMGLIFKITENK